MKIAINGKTGRMGTALMGCIAEDASLSVISLTDKPDVVIDFSHPTSTLSILPYVVENGIPLVIGTTGFLGAQQVAIARAAESTVIVMSPNMSVGVNLCQKLLEQMVKSLGDVADIGITEIHHKAKKDMPSGTALRFQEVIKGSGYAKDIQCVSLRLSDITGEHRVTFALPGETIELTHRAYARSNFAQGAIRAARWAVHQKKAGLYDMSHVLGL